MIKDRNAFKAGLFILISIALVVGIIFGIQGTGHWFHPMRTVITAFDLDENLGGLRVGDPVRIGGYDQGHVTNIYLVPDGSDKQPQFYVVFTLPTSYDLRANAAIQVEQALTGAADLNITSLGNGAPYTDGVPLDGLPSSLSEIYAVAPQASKLLAHVDSKVDPGYDEYKKTMNQAADTLAAGKKAIETGRQALEPIRDVLGDGKTDLRTTIANVNSATGTLRTRLPTTLDRIDNFVDTVKKTIDDTHDTLVDIRQSAANTKDITGEVRSALLRNKSKIDHMVDSFRNTSTNLEGASVEIRHSPWRLLYKPTSAEMQNINVIDSARQFAEGASQVNDAAAALRDALKDPNADKRRIQQLMDTLDSSFQNYNHVEDALWKAVK